MNKYVAFLDILGFKAMLKQLGHVAAKQYISAFAATAYHEWERLNPKHLEGSIVSDSFIIYTKDTTCSALTELITVIDRICKKEFSENEILIRGAIAKGEFDKMPAVELSNLSKGLIVGQAYVDAYTMENAAKVAGISLTEEVYADIGELGNQFGCTEEKMPNSTNYIMKYLDYDYLSIPDNMRIYVNLAADSNWLPHYYNTLYFAIKAEQNSNKATELFDCIITSFGDPSEYWQEIDKFIKNAFDNDVVFNFQRRFLKYIREQIVVRRKLKYAANNRLNNSDRILNFIAEHGHLTISEISTTLGISRPTTARIVNSLTDEGVLTTESAEVTLLDRSKRSVNKYSIKEN